MMKVVHINFKYLLESIGIHAFFKIYENKMKNKSSLTIIVAHKT